MPALAGWRPHLTIFAVVSLLDLASTWLAMQIGLAEGNALPALLLRAGGVEALFLFKAATVLLAIAFVLRWSRYYPRLWGGVRATNWLLAMVVLSNVVQIVAA